MVAMRATLLYAAVLASIGCAGGAQEYYPSLPTPQLGPFDLAPAEYSGAYAPYQLDQMLAPIALYPDPLLSQILAASAYPLQVVEAARWLQDPAQSSLSAGALAAAAGQQPWDGSVKALTSLPQVLQTMDANLSWLQALGSAAATERPAVMDAVQRLRREALAAGTLASTPQQAVQDQGGFIAILPVNPDTVYVPYYNAAQAYGNWPYAGYAPYSFGPPAGVYYTGGVIFGRGYDWHDAGHQGFPHGAPTMPSHTPAQTTPHAPSSPPLTYPGTAGHSPSAYPAQHPPGQPMPSSGSHVPLATAHPEAAPDARDVSNTR